MPQHRPRPTQRLRRCDRRVARLLRHEPGIELARALAARVDALIELGEDDAARAQVDELVGLVRGLGGREAQELLVRGLVRRVRLGLGREERHAEALADVERALAEAEVFAGDPPLEVRELVVELHLHRARLLLMSGEAITARLVLEAAVALAQELPGPARRVFLLRARRELGVARAHLEPEGGLEELARARALLGEGRPDGVPAPDRDLLVATEAEVLANAGRVAEALRLLEAAGDAPWALSQRAATLDLAERGEEAAEVGALLIERLSERLDPRDPDACHELADALLAQARRLDDEEEQRALTGRACGLLDEFPRLPARSLRLLAQGLEAHAQAHDGAEAHECLRRRAHLLEGLVRDLGQEQDVVELVRTYLQDGDVLVRLGEPHVARRCYRWAIDLLRRIEDPEHPAVRALMPLALCALGHALAHCDLWLEARRTLDEASAAVPRAVPPAALARLGDLYLFRAVAYVTTGDAEGAAAALRKDVARHLDVALREEPTSEAGQALLETTTNLCVLLAEVLADHLDRPDDAVASYDQAAALCDLRAEGKDEARAAVLGAKATMLTERGRTAESLPLHRQVVALVREDGGEDGGDLAQALVHLAASLTGQGAPRDALTTIQEAGAVLDGLAAADEDDDDEDDDDEGEDDDRAQLELLRGHLFHQRGRALFEVGHPLLAVDDLTLAVGICRRLLERRDEPSHEARQQLPLTLLLRARSWLRAGEHEDDARDDLREARRLLRDLVEADARPAHRRALDEVRALQRSLRRRPT